MTKATSPQEKEGKRNKGRRSTDIQQQIKPHAHLSLHPTMHHLFCNVQEKSSYLLQYMKRRFLRSFPLTFGSISLILLMTDFGCQIVSLPNAVKIEFKNGKQMISYRKIISQCIQSTNGTLWRSLRCKIKLVVQALIQRFYASGILLPLFQTIMQSFILMQNNKKRD